MGVGYEFSRDSIESSQIANWRSPYDEDAFVSDKPDDAISGAREPQLDPRIQNLVRGRVPSETKNEIARSLVQ
jgi:hypothetical protein